jgi:hypothetical protein
MQPFDRRLEAEMLYVHMYTCYLAFVNDICGYF